MMIVVDLWPSPTASRIDLGEEPAFDLGGMRVVPAERTVILNGERRELQPRVMQVLVALAKARPDVVSRDKLIDLCWEGRVVGDDRTPVATVGLVWSQRNTDFFGRDDAGDRVRARGCAVTCAAPPAG